MKTFFSEPLVQFVIIGSLLFIALQTLTPQSVTGHDVYDIVVSDEALINYQQLQAKSFRKGAGKQLFHALPADEKKTLVNDYVRDQVLFREAIALGLDENDEVIRRRLIQKMEYINQGFYNEAPPITESALTAFFTENQSDYQVEASVSFTHIFFAHEKHGREKSKVMAQTLLFDFNKQPAAFTEASQFGDRFLFNRNYIERTENYIRGHFGGAFENSLFNLKPSSQWQGPFQSNYGSHLVLMTATSLARLPNLDEVSPLVLADAQRQQQESIKRQAFSELLQKYTVSQADSHE